MRRMGLVVTAVALFLSSASCDGSGGQEVPPTTARETAQGVVTLRAIPDADSTELKLLVTSAWCSGGTIPAGIHSVDVKESADEVVVDVRIELPGGTWPTTCPPNPYLSAVAPLEAPLGDRSVRAIGEPGSDYLWPVAANQMDHGFTTTTVEGQPMVGEGLDNAAPMGTAMSVGGWNVVVTGRVAPPGPDELTAVTIAAAYIEKPGFGRFFDDVRVVAVNRAGEELDLVQDGCPLALEQLEPAEPGDLLEGNLCFRLPGGWAGLKLLLTAQEGPTRHVVYLATE